MKKFLLLLLLCVTVTCYGNRGKDPQDLWHLDVSTSFLPMLSDYGVCKSFKLEAYGFMGKNWKREYKDEAKSKGKNTYLYWNLSFFNAIRYNLYPSGINGSEQCMGNFAWSIMTAKFYLCFVRNPRIMTDLYFSFDATLPKIYCGISIEQGVYYYIFSRCAMGIGAGVYIIAGKDKWGIFLKDAYPCASVHLLFDI